jgi:hypothetical protein
MFMLCGVMHCGFYTKFTVGWSNVLWLSYKPSCPIMCCIMAFMQTFLSYSIMHHVDFTETFLSCGFMHYGFKRKRPIFWCWVPVAFMQTFLCYGAKQCDFHTNLPILWYHALWFLNNPSCLKESSTVAFVKIFLSNGVIHCVFYSSLPVLWCLAL